jgi:hypothetical protein
LWTAESRCYLLAYGTDMPHLEQLVGKSNLHVVAEGAGNYLLTNQPLLSRVSLGEAPARISSK